MEKKKNPLIYKLMLLTATIVWGGAFVVVKNTVNAVPPYTLLAVRFTLAALLLLPLCIKRFKRLTADMLAKSLAISVFMFLGFALQTVGVQSTTPGKNAFLTAVYCVIVPFICCFTEKKRPDAFNFAAGILCLAGIGLVSLSGSLSINTGDSLTLLCGVAFSIAIVLVAKFGKDCDILLLTLIEFVSMAALSWISSVFAHESIAAVGWSSSVITSFVFLALFSSCISTVFQNVGQQHTDASSASLILSLEAVFGVIFSVVFYGEAVTLKTAVGFVLIFAAVVVSETKLSFLKKAK